MDDYTLPKPPLPSPYREFSALVHDVQTRLWDDLLNHFNNWGVPLEVTAAAIRQALKQAEL